MSSLASVLLLLEPQLNIQGPFGLKCRFYYYAGTVKPTDQEPTATETVVCCSQFPCQSGPHREAPGLVYEAEELKENVARASIMVFMGKARQDRANGLRIG